MMKDSYLQEISKQLVPMIQFDLLKSIDFIGHGFSTKLGGVSHGIFQSMNLSFNRGDNAEHVMQNYKIIGETLGFSFEQLVLSHQTHTTNVKVVTKEHCGEGILRERSFQDVDGLITNEENVVLATSYADCVPLFFVDTKTKAIGLSHSGWRGTVGRMGAVTLERMNEAFGTNPADVICAIGPSICQSCYQVDETVYEEFRKEFSKADCEAMFLPEDDGHYRLDLWKANELILLEAGILPENIDNRRICTCCNSDILFSHRATAGKRGNLSAFLYKLPRKC